jgi:hypothetical protein
MKQNQSTRMAMMSDSKLLQFIKFKDLFNPEEFEAASIEALKRGIVDENLEPKSELIAEIDRKEREIINDPKKNPVKHLLFGCLVIVALIISFLVNVIRNVVTKRMKEAEGVLEKPVNIENADVSIWQLIPGSNLILPIVVFVSLVYIARKLIFRPRHEKDIGYSENKE